MTSAKLAKQVPVNPKFADPRRPKLIERSLLVRAEGRHGEWKRADLELEEIVKNRVYVATHDHRKFGVDIRRGNVLSRNLATTRKKGNVEDIGAHAFYKYHSMTSFMRTASDMRASYEEIELPQLKQHGRTISAMLTLSDRLPKHESVLTDAYQELGYSLEQTTARVENVHKREMKRLVHEARLVHDKLGRNNRGRRSWLLWGAQAEEEARTMESLQVAWLWDERAVRCGYYMDILWAVVEELGRGVGIEMGADGRVVRRKRVADPRPADLRFYAKMLRHVHVRPFGPKSFARIAFDLEAAADHLRDGERELAKTCLDKVRRSVQILFALREIETLLMQAHAIRARRLILTEEDIVQVDNVLDDVLENFITSGLDEGFVTQVVDDGRRHIEEALDDLATYREDPFAKMDSFHGHLDQAVAPF